MLKTIFKLILSLLQRPGGKINIGLLVVVAIAAFIVLPLLLGPMIKLIILAAVVLGGVYVYNNFLKK